MQSSPHDSHDRELVAALADRDLDPETRSRAEALIASCPACAALAAEIRLLAVALGDLPAAIPAPRDMRLTPELAARASRRTGWRRLLAPFGGAAGASLRPVGATLAALGLVGILVTNVPLAPRTASLPAAGGDGTYGAAASAPAKAPHASSETTADGKAPSPAAVNQQIPPNGASSAAPELAASPVPPAPGGTTAAGPNTAAGAGGETPTDQSTGAAGPGTTIAADGGGNGPSIPPLTLLSIALLAIGLALLGLRFAARRIA